MGAVFQRHPGPGPGTRRQVLGGACAALLARPWAAASAEERPGAWPNRPVTLVEGYPAGSVTDIASRGIAEVMGRELGQAVVVDNRNGAATSVATTYVARSRPDGYVMGMGTTTLAINPSFQPSLTPREPMRELVPVGMVLRTPFILHVHPSLPVRTLGELIAHAKANPGQVSCGSSGVGAVNHLCLELFKAQAGVDIVHVPYRGSPLALLDMQQGRVQMLFQAPQEASPSIRAGQTRGIAVSVLQRLEDWPGLPPISETLPGFEVTFWQGLFAPVGTPDAVLSRAGAALARATSDRSLRTRMAEQGVELVTGDAAMLRDTLAADTAKWSGVIRTAGLRAD